MASISPSVLNNYAEPFTGKKGYIRLTITEITQTGGAQNQTTVKWKLTVEGTPYVYLYAARATLGGRVLYDHHTGGAILTSWSAGQTIASGQETFTNANDGKLTLFAEVKQMFYYGNRDTSRWNNSSFYQYNSTNMVCSQIPRYATPYQSVNDTGDNYIKMNWGADVSCDWLQYSINGGKSWVDASGYPVYTISGLTPNTTYSIATRVRRQDSQLWSNTSAMNVTTLASPYISALSDFNIGTSFACTIYNPKGRSLKLSLLTSDGTTILERTTSNNGTYTFVTTDSENDALYNKIADSPSGSFRVKVYCSDLNSTTYSNDKVGYKTFYAVESNCKPTLTIASMDINAKSLNLTGDSLSVIKYVSNVQSEITAMGVKGATIKSGTITCADGKSYSFTSNDISVIKRTIFNAVESGIFRASITDSRGFSSETEISLNMINYVKLTLNAETHRPSPTNGSVALTFNGNYFNDNFGKVDNTLTIKYRYKNHSEDIYSEWFNLNPVKKNNTYSNGTREIEVPALFNYMEQFDFEFKVTDKISDDNDPVLDYSLVKNGNPIYDWGKEDFNINGKLNIFEVSIIRHIANILWPLNSMFISPTNSIPKYLAGEWSLTDTIVNNGKTYYVYKRISENEKLHYNNVELLFNGEQIYIENNLLRGDDVL